MRKETIGGLYLLLFLIHLLSGLLVASRAEFPTSVDELAHYSYVAEMRENFSLAPRFEDMRLLDPKDGSPTGRPNYMTHPPVYYLLLAHLPFDVVWMRAANILISALAVGLLCLAGYRYLQDPMQHLVFASAVALCPKAQILSGMINNDNLALLGGAVVLCGLLRERSLSSALLVGAGFALGALSKLNAGLLLGLLIAAVHLRDVRSLQFRYVVVICLFAVIGVAPYLVNLVAYGSPVYIDGSTHFVPEGERLKLNVIDFVFRFFAQIPYTWPALEPGNALNVIPLGILLALALLSRDANARGGVLLLVLALAVMLHIGFMYRLYLEVGYSHGAYFRYYLPLWPVIAWGAAWGLKRLPKRSHAVTGIVLMLLMLYSSVPLSRSAFVHI